MAENGVNLAKIKKQHKAEITEIKKVSKTLYHIKFVPDSSFVAVPGQFVSILCSDFTMRRPFSIASFENNEISVLFKKKGGGTEYISKLKKADKIDFIGAMGNGFKYKNKQRSLLVGAGVGIAPVFYLKNEMDKINSENRLLAGFMTKDEIPENMKIDSVCTNDGSFGLKGSILDYLEKEIIHYKPDKIYACGPMIVLKITTEIAQKHNIPCEIAMEKVMACSIGVCRGCVIQVNKNGKIVNASVCQDGPVFLGNEVVW